MSLKSRKSIDSVGPDYHDETSITFRRETDGTYTKITKTMRRDRKNGSIKEMKRIKPIESGPYEVTSDTSGYDEKIQFQDFSGEMMFVYLRKVETDHETG